MPLDTSPTHRVAVIGSGPGGVRTAARLRKAGIEDFVVLERADAVGGTWRRNRYPGLSCDIASHFYSFSFAPKPDWSRPFAGQVEILAYLEEVVSAFDVRPHIRFSTTVEAAHWDHETARWRLITRSDADPRQHRSTRSRITAGLTRQATGSPPRAWCPRANQEEPMTQFDTTKLRWIESHGDDSTSYRIHLETSILGYDRDAGTIDFLLRFDSNGGHCPAHRHVTTTSVFVLEGEQHLTDMLPGGQRVHKVRKAGGYHLTNGDVHPHMERGGPNGALIFYSHHTKDGRLYELVDEDRKVIHVVTLDDLANGWEVQA